MKHIVSFSGGRTSAYLCHAMKKIHGDNVDFIFFNTGAEHPKTYEFIKKVNKEFDLNLTCLQVDINKNGHHRKNKNSYSIVDINSMSCNLSAFSDVMGRYGRPSFGMASCTREMKSKVSNKYVKDNYLKGEFSVWLGIRIDEPKRINLENKDSLRYMAEVSDFDKQDVLDWWSAMPFDLEIDEHLGNCVFCVKKSIIKVALAARDEPALAEEWAGALNDANNRDDLTNPTYRAGNAVGVIYRGYNSFGSIIKMFSEHSRGEIESRIRGGKNNDSNSCSESCEAFGQQDMFNELDNQEVNK
tara:strand:+ start:42 stop:941 length:900 start_codon:yes stop_codon:yes gene_type:complete